LVPGQLPNLIDSFGIGSLDVFGDIVENIEYLHFILIVLSINILNVETDQECPQFIFVKFQVIT